MLSRQSRVVVVFLVTVSALAQSSTAATLTWDANGLTGGQTDGGGTWDSGSFWWNGATNVIWTSGSDAVFGNGGTGGIVTLTSATVANSLTFNSFSGTYTLGTAGQTIALNNGIAMNSTAGAVTIVSPISLGGAQSWTNNSSNLLTVSGDIANGANLLTIGGTGDTTLSGVLGNGAGGLAASRSCCARRWRRRARRRRWGAHEGRHGHIDVVGRQYP